MTAEEPQRAELVNYLAGSMPEEARVRFEEKLLTSESFSDAAAHLEQELVDEYATGSLPAVEKEALQPWFEGSAHRKLRVEMARTLLKERRPARRRPWLWGAVAACLIALITSVIVRRSETPAREEVAQSPVRPADNATTNGPQQPSPQVVLLVAERVRGGQPVATYHVSPQAPVELQVILTDEAAQKSYSIAITSSGRPPRTHFEVSHLEPHVKAEHVYVETVFPPGALPPGAYTAVVGGAGATLVAHFTIAR